MSDDRRIIAQRIRTGEFLSWDVPLLNANTTRELSGPGGIFGSIKPKTKTLLGPDGKPLLREWSTALYYEADGEIRAAGIIERIIEDDEGDTLTLEAPGFTRYPKGIPYMGNYHPGLGADPLDTVREIWRHLQAAPDGDLGVTLDSTNSREVLDDTSQTPAKPYVLGWWDNRDCGAEIDTMLEIANADYIERHTWNDDHTEILHHIDLGIPRVGRRRTDMRFAEGENVIRAIPYEIDGDRFAQTVIGLGKGEGRKMVRAEVATRDDRLRRVAVVADKAAGHAAIARLARREHSRRKDADTFTQVIVKDHKNARIAAISPGDDILVDANLRWYGRTRQWVRVLSIDEATDGPEVAVLNVAASSRYTN